VLRTLALALAIAAFAAPAAAQDASLSDRLAAIEADVREGEADLVAQARTALDEAETRRAASDAAGALRAERIAGAALELVLVRRARAEALRIEAETRARRAELEERLRLAREALAAAERERERLAGTGP
jgi:hypothetical protein